MTDENHHHVALVCPLFAVENEIRACFLPGWKNGPMYEFRAEGHRMRTEAELREFYSAVIVDIDLREDLGMYDSIYEMKNVQRRLLEWILK